MQRVLGLLLVLICGAVMAQAPLAAVDGGTLGYRLGYPSDWVLEMEADGSYVNVQPGPGQPGHGLVAIEFVADPDVDGTLDEGITEVLAALRANVLPDLTVRSRASTTVSGVPAVVIHLTGTAEGPHPVTYRLVFVLQGRTGYVLFLEALSEHFAAYEPLFDQVQASFVLTQAEVLPGPPLGPLPPLLGAPTYAGTFAGDQLRLVLEASPLPGGAYVGTLHHGDQRYPVVARLEPSGLVGDFESGGNRFPFTATLVGDALTFVSGGISYTLVREATAVGPVNPLGGTPPVSPLPTPPAPAEVVARETGTAFIGEVPVPGRARGRLDGMRDRISFHTYVVQVPAGAVRLVLELDADVDLDIAIKHGSEIDSFADKASGGDWDYRDIGTQNPTVVVIEQPRAGTWYIDVMNALGDGLNGSYVLTITTAGSGF